MELNANHFFGNFQISFITIVMNSILSSAYKLISNLFRTRMEKYLSHVNGVIHVGANIGQEREAYAKYDLNVLWIEPIPEIFEKLSNNIVPFPKQRALNLLLTDMDDKEYPFFISNNNGESSSIYELAEHKDVWPSIYYSSEIKLKSKTLSTVMIEQNLNIADYEMLILDTQGSELLILQGAGQLLSQFKYILVEASDFEPYKGAAPLKEIEQYLKRFNFRELKRNANSSHPNGGRYYDILFCRV